MVIGGLIESVREILTKNGERMLFIKFTDLTDSVECGGFPRIFKEFSEIFVEDQCGC